MMEQMTLLRPYNNLRIRPLRPRQAQAIADIRQAIKEGHKRIIVQGPCGFGKTLTSAHLIGGALTKGTRPLFTCPAISLIDQTVKAFESEGIRDIGVMQSQHIRTDREAQIQVASVQTLIKRELPDVDFMILDEIHRTFKGLNEMLDGPWKDKIAIGLTATPWVKGMGLRWTKLIIPATIPQLIEEGFLTPTTLYVPEQIANRENIAVEKGEFTEASSSQEMRQNRIVGNVVETWQKLGPGEKTFIFCVNLDHARAQMAAFIDSGIPFGYIDAQTPPEERTLQFKKMQHGEIAGIASVGCLIAGVDEDVRCVIDAAPTKSEISLVQRWGRGIRTAIGKPALIGLDHAGNNTDQGLGLFWEIFHDHLDTHKPHEKGVAYEGEKRPSKPRRCAVCHALIPAGSATCKACGEVIHATGIEHEDGELVVYGTPPKEKATKREFTMQEKQDFFSGLIWLYKERGKGKPEAIAAHRYREKFGVWPNSLLKVARPPSFEVEQFDRHCRIRWAKSKAKESAVAAEA
jgi:superfamily II DNA or RNA helicase